MKNIQRIDDLGRVVIIKDIRKHLGINAGDELQVDVDEDEGKIIITKCISENKEVIKRRKYYKRRGFSDVDIRRLISDDIRAGVISDK